MNRLIFFIWFLPLIFMGIAFYVLISSNAPVAAKAIFSIVPLLIWILGGIAIYREHHQQEKERRKQEEIIQEANRILRTKTRLEEKRE
jgi:preprotein translocase subunit YajC